MPQQTTDKALLHALMEAAVDAIVIADKAGRILRTNRAASQLFGHSEQQMQGENLKMLMPTAMAKRHDGFLAHHEETGEARIIGLGRDLDGLRRDGTTFPLHLSVGRSESSGRVLFIGILRDMTAQRLTEQALERSQRMEAIGQMTGGISHDFNNMLTIITGNLELLQMDKGDRHALITDALDAAELGADLTSRLLTFARKSALSPECLNVNPLVARVIDLMKAANSAGQKMIAKLDQDLWQANVDPGQLQTALLNLVRNAQDAITGPGIITLETTNARIDDAYIAQETDILSGDYVRITISDTGQGITPGIRKRALEPFFTTKPGGKGTGLGLATVYGFVRQTDGYISIYSEAGQGTSVNIYLPVAVAGADARRMTPVAAEPRRGNGETILIVENDYSVRRLAYKRLESLGYVVIGAASADAALVRLDDGAKVDLVFTDLVMPGTLSGYDLALELRSTRPDLPVLLTNGYAGDVLNTETIEKAAFPLLRKPYRQHDLARAIRTALNGFGLDGSG